MTTLDWLLCAAAVPVLLVLLRYAIGLTQLRALRLAPRRAEPVAADEVPAGLREALADGIDALRELGFPDCTWHRMPTLLATREPCSQWFASALHAEHGVVAAVLPSEEPEPGWLWEPSFASYFDDGTALLTTDCRAHVLAPFREALALADDYVGTVTEPWTAHLARVAAHPGTPLRDPAGLAARDAALLAAVFDTALAQGRLEREATGLYRLSWRGALDYLREYTRGSKRRVAAMMKRRGAGPAPAPDHRLAAVDAVVMTPSLLATKGDAMSFTARLALLVTTAAVSFAAFAWTLGLEFAAWLIATLAFHEAGHFLLMKRYDYANLKVFFVPFLGAAVSGHHTEATAAQRVAIYLAGPVPGLLLGSLLIAGFIGHWWPGSGAAWTLAVLLVAINYTNLLPFEPLDGGRIVGLLWFARHPRLRIAMFGLGLCALAALAIASGSRAFVIFCVFIALGLPYVYRQSRLLERLRADGVPADEREAVAALCARLVAAQPALPFAQRHATVKGLLPDLRLPLPTRREIVVGSSAYVAAMLAPLVLAVSLLGGEVLLAVPGLADLRALADVRQHERRVAEAHTPLARWQANLDASRYFLQRRRQPARAAPYLREAVALSTQLAPDDARRAEAVLLLAVAVDAREAATALEAALPMLSAAQLPDARARVLEQLSTRAPDEHRERSQWLEEALTLRERDANSNPFRLLALRAQLAVARRDAGDVAGAVQVLRESFEQTRAQPRASADEDEAARALRLDAASQLAWLLVDLGRAAEALAVIDAARADAALSPAPARRAYTVLEAWALHGAMRDEEALALLAPHLEATASPVSDPVDEFLVATDLALFCRHAGRDDCAGRALTRLRALLDEQAYLTDLVPALLGEEGSPLQASRRRQQRDFLAGAGLGRAFATDAVR